MKTVDVATKPGLKSGAKTAFAALTVGGVAGTATAWLTGQHVDVPSVIVAALLLGGAGYGISRVEGVSDSSAEAEEPAEGTDATTADEETTHAAGAAS